MRLPPPLWLLKIRANIIKTIYFNFKFFEWKTAIKLPIILVGKVDLKKCGGNIVLTETPHFGMIVIGMPNPPQPNSYNTVFWIDGTLEIGDYVRICKGSSIHVNKGGVLTIGNQVRINVNCRLWCIQRINIGDYCGFSWDCQIFDSNFHYMVNSDGFTKKHSSSVIIGKSCWFGNRVTINKGTYLPNYTIIAAGAFVNKDFSKYDKGLMIGGIPAKIISQGVYKRVINIRKEKEIDSFFDNNPDKIYLKIGTEESLFCWH
jgi:acetyltransferase-like isoleucine patch superfamily enzyme